MTPRLDAVEFQGSWISPSNVADYLTKHGWTSLGGRNRTYLRFRPPASSDRSDSVLLPLDPSNEDFADLLDDALATIAQLGNIADRRLLLDLNVGVGDKIRFRKDVATPYGSIRWLDGEELITSSTKMLVAAAKAQRQKVPYFGNRHRTQAAAYLNAVRMGQTDLGSYIITAFSPVEQIVGAESPLPELGPPATGRAVTQTLMTALEATRESIDYFHSRSSFSLFREAVNVGASCELSRSLIGMVRESNGADVSVEWDTPEDRGSFQTSASFTPDDLPALEHAASKFAQTAPAESVRVLGTVTLLDRPRPRAPGVFRLNVLEGSQAKKIRVRVGSQDYELAINAFREGRGLLISGRQEKEGQLWWLYDPEDVQVVSLPQSSLFEHIAAAEADDPEDDA